MNLDCCFVVVWPQASEANIRTNSSYNPESAVCLEQTSDDTLGPYIYIIGGCDT